MVTRAVGCRGLAVALIGAMAGSGCVSVGVRPPEQLVGTTALCAIEVNVYESIKDRKADRHTPRAIVSEVWRKEKDGKTLVREAREAHWSATDLEPGTYLVRVRRWVDDRGAEHRLTSSDSARFAVGAGKQLRIEVVLKHPGRVVTAGVVAAVVVGVGAAIAANAMSGWTLDLAFH
jgi:hypothetical protein